MGQMYLGTVLKDYFIHLLSSFLVEDLAPFFFSFKALLRHNSHTIQFTHLKCTIQCFEYIQRYVQPPVITANLRAFSIISRRDSTSFICHPLCPYPPVSQHYHEFFLS